LTRCGSTRDDPRTAVAALVAGMLEGRPWPERLRRAAALSTAAVAHPVAGALDAGRFPERLEMTRVDVV
jgi:tagatose 6-phosphate kinase